MNEITPEDSPSYQSPSSRKLIHNRPSIVGSPVKKNYSPRKPSVFSKDVTRKPIAVLSEDVVEAIKIQTRRLKNDRIKKAAQIFSKNTQVPNPIYPCEQVKAFNNVPTELKQLIDDQSSGFVNEAFNQQKLEDGEVLVDQIELNYRRLKQDYKYRFPELSFRQLIDELSAQLKRKNTKTSVLAFLGQLLMKTIKPSNPLLLLWNFIKMLIILHTVFSFPLQDSFGSIFYNLECQALDDIIFVEFVFLVTDIMLNFNIEAYSNGDLITDKRMIAKIYIQNEFVGDVLSVVAFMTNRYMLLSGSCHSQIEGQHTVLQTVKYLFFLKLKQFNKFLSVLRNEFDQQGHYQSYLKLVKLFFQILMLAHLIACFWIKVSRVSQEWYNKGWLLTRDLDQSTDWVLIYAQAMYFACMTMTTVGYGDILPQNTVEYVVCIIIMLISCGFFAYSLNTITSMLSDINKSKIEYKRQCDLITNYMTKKNVDKSLQKRVKNYLKCMHKSGVSDQIAQEEQAVQQLSLQLKSELNFSDKGKMIMQIELFNRQFSLNLVKQLTTKVQEHSYSPQEIITQTTGTVLFVFSGEIEVVFEKKINEKVYTKTLYTLQKGQYLGLQNLFGGTSSCAIKSKDFTIIYTINRADFLDSITNKSVLHADYEKYCMFRDHIVMQNDTTDMLLRCPACKQITHDFFQCSKMFYLPNRIYVIQKYNFNQINNRQQYKRRRARSLGLSNVQQVQQAAQEFNKSDSDTSSQSEQTEKSAVQSLQCIKEENDDEMENEIEHENEDGSESNRSWLIPDSTDQCRGKPNLLDLQVMPSKQSKKKITLKIGTAMRIPLEETRRDSYSPWNTIQVASQEPELDTFSVSRRIDKKRSNIMLDRRKSRQILLEKNLIQQAVLAHSQNQQKIHSRDKNEEHGTPLYTGQGETHMLSTQNNLELEDFCSFDLDCARHWQHYSPQNNLMEVIKQYNKIIQKTKKSLKKNRNMIRMRTLMQFQRRKQSIEPI